MTNSDIIEAAALETEKMLAYYFGKATRPSEIPYGIARAALAAVTPLIEADVLERAAKVAEKHTGWPATIPEQWAREEVAAAIRALKEQPAESSAA